MRLEARIEGRQTGPAAPVPEIVMVVHGAFLLASAGAVSRAFGRRLVAWDGTDLDAADTSANRAGFGCHRGSAPKLRLVALIECGTRAVIDAAFDGFDQVP